MTLVYLAGPINGCTDDESTTWREIVKDALGEDNCLDPMRRDYRGIEDESVNEIVQGDIEDITLSDVVLANCWQASFGTAMETWHASQSLGKPVVSVTPPGAPVSPWLRYISFAVVDNLDDGIAAALQVVDG